MSTYTVHYFAGYGRAEAIRMLLAHSGTAYEEKNYTFADMPELRASGKLEFGQLPALERDGKMYVQSTAVIRGLGIHFGYYPEDPYHAYLVDSAVDAVGDLLAAFYKGAFAPTEEAKTQAFSDLTNSVLPRFFGAFEKRLESNQSGFFVGDKISIADFVIGAMAYSSFLNENSPYREILFPVAE